MATDLLYKFEVVKKYKDFKASIIEKIKKIGLLNEVKQARSETECK